MKNLKKYLLLLIILLIASLNFNLILKPLNLVTGGTQGLALVLNHLFKFSPALTILVINILMLIISYFILPKSTTYGTIVATFIYPLFIKITSFIPTISNQNYSLLFVILSGVICGITGGYIYKLGFSSGGLNLVSLVLKKYFNINIAITNFCLNTIIILLGYVYFGLLKCIYSILIIIINSYLISKILKK